MSEKGARELPSEAVVLGLYSGADSARARRSRKILPFALGFFCLLYGFFFALTAPHLIVPMLAPIAVLGLLVIWALPHTYSPPTRAMSGLFAAFYLALFLWPNYIAIALPGLPWITLLRLFGVPMTILLLTSVSTSSAFRQTMATSLSAAPLVWKLLCVFVLMQFVTLPFSHDISASLSKVIVYQTLWTAVFFVSVYVFLTPTRAERWAAALCIMAVALSVLSVLEFRAQKVLWAGHIPGFLKIEDADRYLRPAWRSMSHIYRAKATFGHPLNLAEFLALTMPFMLHFVVANYRLVYRLAAACSAVLLVYSITLTDSRLGIIGVLIAIVMTLLFQAVLHLRRTRGSLIAAAIVFAYPAIFVGAVGATFVVSPLRAKVWGTSATAASNASRDAQVARGVPRIISNPIGHGSGQSGSVAGTTSVTGQVSIDNYHLMVAVEYGVLGFIAYFGMIFAAIYYASMSAYYHDPRGDRDLALLPPLAISLTSFFVIKSVFSQQDNHPLAFMMLGLVVALVYRSKLAGARSAADVARTSTEPANRGLIGVQ